MTINIVDTLFVDCQWPTTPGDGSSFADPLIDLADAVTYALGPTGTSNGIAGISLASGACTVDALPPITRSFVIGGPASGGAVISAVAAVPTTLISVTGGSGVRVAIENVEIDGSSFQSITDCSQFVKGIVFDPGTTGELDRVYIHGVRQSDAGFGCQGRQSTVEVTTADISIFDSRIEAFQKTAVLTYGPTGLADPAPTPSLIVSGTTIVGVDPTSFPIPTQQSGNMLQFRAGSPRPSQTTASRSSAPPAPRANSAPTSRPTILSATPSYSIPRPSS